MKLPWADDVRIGFWINQPTVRLYYGIMSDAVNRVTVRGIQGRWITLNLEPLSIDDNDTILVIDVPARWLMEHMDQRLEGNSEERKRRLLSQAEYENWKGTDFQYYFSAKIRIANLVPSRYITGYTARP